MVKTKSKHNWSTLIVRIISASIGVWVILIGPIASWEGREFPNQNELHYTSGILQQNQEMVGSRAKYFITIISLMDKKNSTRMNFFCDYTAYIGSSMSECLSKEKLTPHLNKPATIGYYYQKDFLWFHNPAPQLVTLEIDGQVISSYQDKVLEIKRRQKSYLYFSGFFSAIMLAIFGISDYYIRKSL